MSLELDYTVIIQFFMFLSVLLVLNGWVFQPILRVIEARRKKTVEAFESAEAFSKNATGYITDYRDKLNVHRGVLRDMREKVRQELAGYETGRIQKLRAEFLATMKETKINVSAQFKKAEQELSSEIDDISKEIFNKLMPSKS